MNFINQLWNSISNFQFYKSLQNESLGKAFLYLTKVVIIFGVISLIRPVAVFDRGVDMAREYFIENIPDFVFEDGELTVTGEQPYIWEDDENNFIVAMDTSGQIEPEILDDYNDGVYITNHYFIVKQDGIEKRELSFSQLVGAKFTKNDVAEWIPYAKWASGFIIIFGLIGFFVGKLWSALLITLFGLIICSGKLQFTNVYKISIYALTLPVITKTTVGLLGRPIPWIGLVYYGIATFYIWKAIDIIRNDKTFIA
jgi:hypothetical protein